MIIMLRRTLSFLLLLVSIVLIVWGIWPRRHRILEKFIMPDEMRLSTNIYPSYPTLLEVRQVKLEWPTSMRIGDNSTITLDFEPVSSEILASPPDIELSDAYNDFNLMVEGRFEVAGMKVVPGNTRRASLLTGQRIQLTWQVSTLEARSYTGNVWLFLRYLPLAGGEPAEQLIFIHELKIQSVSLLGLSGTMTRLLGGVGIVAGMALSYDIMIRTIRWLIIKSHRIIQRH